MTATNLNWDRRAAIRRCHRSRGCSPSLSLSPLSLSPLFSLPPSLSPSPSLSPRFAAADWAEETDDGMSSRRKEGGSEGERNSGNEREGRK